MIVSYGHVYVFPSPFPKGEAGRGCLNSLLYIILQVRNFYTFLFARIAIADSDSVVGQSIKVHHDAPWRTYLILPAITLANVAVIIPDNSAELGLERSK